MAARARIAAPLLLCLLAATCGGGGHPSATTSAGADVRARIEYRVTGQATSVTLSYGNKHHRRRITVPLPWSHVGSAFEGTTVVLDASQPSSNRGYRISCVLSVTIPGNPALVSRDSSHIVGIKAEGGPQKILYDGQCNTSAVVSLTGLS
jgi:hypothetical protein